MGKCHKTSCPFAYTEESEMVQNYGCLPSPIEILNMSVNYGKTWACHSNHTKPCIGGLKRLKELGYDTSNKQLITENDNWSFPIDDKFYKEITERDNNRLKKIYHENWKKI
jgi:hypothetical protein